MRGSSASGALSTSGVYDANTNRAERRPLVTSISATVVHDSLPFTVGGTRFAGDSEAGGGATQSSAVNHPLVELRSIENGRVVPLVHHGLSVPFGGVKTIATYISQDGILDLSLLGENGHKVLVTGYGFLTNAASEISARWKARLGDNTPEVDDSLVGGNWGSNVAARRIALRAKLSGNYGVMAIAGHATHYEEGVPGNGSFDDIEGLSTADIFGPDSCATPTAGALDFSGAVIYAAGCHGGLGVPGSCLSTDPNHSLDLPQTMLSRGAVAYIANSGYGWGLRYGIGYGARLMQIFTEEITTGESHVVGDVVKRSKERYIQESPRFDSYDERSVMQWTLYGLPMYAVKTIAAASAKAPAAEASTEMVGAVRVKRQLIEPTGPQEPTGVQSDAIASNALPQYLTQLTLSFDFTGAGVYKRHNSAGAVLLEGLGWPDANGCFYSLNGLYDRGTGSADLPIEPYLIYDSKLSGTSQHGVLWKGGTYDEESPWKPVFAELVSNGGDGSNHGVAPRVIIHRPTSPRVSLGPDPPDCRPSDGELNSLTLTPRARAALPSRSRRRRRSARSRPLAAASTAVPRSRLRAAVSSPADR